jgi:natural resistance-associated macrophage protein
MYSCSDGTFLQGFLLLKWPRWVRVLVTRLIAIGPTLSLAIISGANFSGWNEMLNVLQSLQLPFALIPIITFTGSYKVMGEFAMSRCVSIHISLLFSIIHSVVCTTNVKYWNYNPPTHRLSCALIWLLAAGVMAINGYFVVTYLQLLPHSVPIYVLVAFFLLIYLSLVVYLGHMAVQYNTQQRPYIVSGFDLLQIERMAQHPV